MQFVNNNYHEPVYAQLLNDHAALQRIYNDLQTKLQANNAIKTVDENQNFAQRSEAQENGINLILAEQIRVLKEREAQLMFEAEELREQNDLMEFRILELEECRKEVGVDFLAVRIITVFGTVLTLICALFYFRK